MDQVSIHQAKTQLVPFHGVVRQPSRLKGKIKISRDFDPPLPEALAAAFRREGT